MIGSPAHTAPPPLKISGPSAIGRARASSKRQPLAIGGIGPHLAGGVVAVEQRTELAKPDKSDLCAPIPGSNGSATNQVVSAPRTSLRHPATTRLIC
jgi:hypothetical protein